MWQWYQNYEQFLAIQYVNFCVGQTVSGKSPVVSRIFLKDPLVNLEHFDTNLMGAADCGKKFWPKNRPKIDFTGIEIA